MKNMCEKITGVSMKHLRSMRNVVSIKMARSMRPATRWLLGLAIFGCCFFFVKQELASAAKVTDRQNEEVLEKKSSSQEKTSFLVTKNSKHIASSANSKQVPPAFGKSHFIVGMSAEETARFSAKLPTVEQEDVSVNACDMVCLGAFPQVLFSPHDDVRKALVHLIDNEKKSIKIAAYAMTEPQVAKALSAAAKRGVTIGLIVDRSCLDMSSNKIKVLRKAGIQVAVFDGKTREDGALMHNKFYLFEENIKNKRLIWTGSANTTKSGYERNHENVMIFEEPTLFARYEKEFKLLGTIAENLKV